MQVERIIDGEFLELNQRDRNALVAEYDADCENLDFICPTFESWLVAKLWDARNTLISYGIQ